MRNGILAMGLATASLCGCYDLGMAIGAGMQNMGNSMQNRQAAPAYRPLVTCTTTRSGNAVYTNCSDGSGCMTTYYGGSPFTTCH